MRSIECVSRVGKRILRIPRGRRVPARCRQRRQKTDAEPVRERSSDEEYVRDSLHATKASFFIPSRLIWKERARTPRSVEWIITQGKARTFGAPSVTRAYLLSVRPYSPTTRFSPGPRLPSGVGVVARIGGKRVCNASRALISRSCNKRRARVARNDMFVNCRVN